MKTYIDFFETLKGEFIGALKFRNKFVRLWGTTIIDDVKVMNKRFTIYPGHTTNKDIQRMCKMLGMWSSVTEAQFNTIAGYYLYFNPAKDSANQAELSRELLAEKIDSFCSKNVWIEGRINYIDKQNPTAFQGKDKQYILDYIDNDYRNIFSNENGFIVADNITEATMSKYVLFDDDNEFEVEVIKTQVVPIDKEIVLNTFNSKTVKYTGLTVEFKYRRIVEDVDPDKSLVTSMIEEKDIYQKEVLAELQRSTSGDDDNAYGNWGQAAVTTNDIWYKDQLRYDVINSSIQRKVAIPIILSLLDTGQIQKKVKWYKKILGFVILVIAVVIAAATQQWELTLPAVAYAVGAAVLVMTLIQAHWAKTNAAAAGYMGRWVRIGSIISTIAGIGATIQGIVREMAKTALVTAAMETGKQTLIAAAAEATVAVTKMSLGEALKTVTLDSVLSTAGQLITSNLKSIAFKVASYAISSRQAKMESNIANKSSELESQEDQIEAFTADKQSNFALEDMKVYTEQIKSAMSRYDYDALYSPEYATIHIGNIQRASSYKVKLPNNIVDDIM